MTALDGTAAWKLDFGDRPARVTSTGGQGRAGLRLAPRPALAAGSDKYRALAIRRRQAQIRARHLLEGLESGD